MVAQTKTHDAHHVKQATNQFSNQTNTKATSIHTGTISPAKKVPKGAKKAGGKLETGDRSKIIEALEKIIKNYQKAKLEQAEAYLKTNVQNMMQQAGISNDDISHVKELMDQATAGSVNSAGDANGTADHQVGNFFMVLFEFLKKNMNENDDQMIATYNHMNGQSQTLTKVAAQLQTTEQTTEHNIYEAHRAAEKEKHNKILGIVLGVVMAVVAVAVTIVSLGTAAPEAVAADVVAETATETAIETSTETAVDATTEAATEATTEASTEGGTQAGDEATEQATTKASRLASKVSQQADKVQEQADNLESQAQKLNRVADKAEKVVQEGKRGSNIARGLAQRARAAANIAKNASNQLSDIASQMQDVATDLGDDFSEVDQNGEIDEAATQQNAQKALDQASTKLNALKNAASETQETVSDGMEDASSKGCGRVARAASAIRANPGKAALGVITLAGATAGPSLGVGVPQANSQASQEEDTMTQEYLSLENVDSQIESNISNQIQTTLKQDFQAGVQATTTNIQNDTNMASQTVQQMTRAQSLGSI